MKLAELYQQEAERQRRFALERAEREAIQTEDTAEPAGADLESVVTNWPSLEPVALHGIAGDFVRMVEPHSEADPAALLVQFLVAVGSAIGPGPFIRTEQDRQTANLYAVLVGQTSRGRKGSSWGHVKSTMKAADPDWTRDHIFSGLSSGEGLIYHVRDAREEEQPVKERGHVVDYQTVVVDQGLSDKRALIVETEFASVLRVMRREGNTLSPVLREAWDRGDLRTMSKNSPLRATGAHVSLLGHITAAELRRYFEETEQANGFGNRILWVCARRSKLLPEGGKLRSEDLNELSGRLCASLEFSRNVGEVDRDREAREVWREVYPDLSRDVPGLLGSVVARAEAQVLRLALLYALLDHRSELAAEHLRAALAAWTYAEDSANYLFGNALGDPVADVILRELRQRPEQGLTRTEISNLLGRHQSTREVERALGLLQNLNLADFQEETSRGGRPAERWKALR